MKHTLNILVNNHPGVMSHVSGLFTRRSYNIDSIAVGVTENPDISSMTIVLKGDDAVVDQVKQQLLKLPDVLKVTDKGSKLYTFDINAKTISGSTVTLKGDVQF